MKELVKYVVGRRVRCPVVVSREHYLRKSHYNFVCCPEPSGLVDATNALREKKKKNCYTGLGEITSCGELVGLVMREDGNGGSRGRAGEEEQVPQQSHTEEESHRAAWSPQRPRQSLRHASCFAEPRLQMCPWQPWRHAWKARQ